MNEQKLCQSSNLAIASLTVTNLFESNDFATLRRKHNYVAVFFSTKTIQAMFPGHKPKQYP